MSMDSPALYHTIGAPRPSRQTLFIYLYAPIVHGIHEVYYYHCQRCTQNVVPAKPNDYKNFHWDAATYCPPN